MELVVNRNKVSVIKKKLPMLPCLLAVGSHFTRLLTGVSIKEKLRPTMIFSPVDIFSL
jgi:hypothetical protein